jgi:hypothetical protein
MAKSQHKVRLPNTRREKKDDTLVAFNEGKAFKIFEPGTRKAAFEPWKINGIEMFGLRHA